MPAADHQERVGMVEERAARQQARGPLARIDEIGVRLTRRRRFAEAEDAVFAVEHDLPISRDEISDQGREANTQIHISAIGNVLWRAPGNLSPRERCCRCAHLAFGTWTTRSTKMPGVTIVSGSSSPRPTISFTCTTVTSAAIAMVGLKFRAAFR